MGAERPLIPQMEDGPTAVGREVVQVRERLRGTGSPASRDWRVSGCAKPEIGAWLEEEVTVCH